MRYAVTAIMKKAADATKASEEVGISAEDKAAFVRMLVANGLAAVADEHGRLPQKATHEIVGYEKDGTPIVVRRRMMG